MSNLGPLTTTYVPSGSNCQSIFMTHDGVLIYGTNWNSRTSSCMPTSFVPVDPYYYSPGICPSGYIYACIATLGNGASDGGTAATCCPTGYACRKGRESGDSAACASELMTDGSLTITQFVDTGTRTLSALVTGFYGSGNFVFANGVAVRRSGDDPGWPISDSATTASTTSILTTAASITRTSPVLGQATSVAMTSVSGNLGSSSGTDSTQAEATQNTTANPGTSATTNVYIGVGVALGIMIISGIITAMYFIRKQKRWAAQADTHTESSQHTEKYASNPTWPSKNDAVELEDQRRYCELVAAHAREPVEC